MNHCGKSGYYCFAYGSYCLLLISMATVKKVISLQYNHNEAKKSIFTGVQRIEERKKKNQAQDDEQKHNQSRNKSPKELNDSVRGILHENVSIHMLSFVVDSLFVFALWVIVSFASILAYEFAANTKLKYESIAWNENTNEEKRKETTDRHTHTQTSKLFSTYRKSFEKSTNRFEMIERSIDRHSYLKFSVRTSGNSNYIFCVRR